MDKKKILIVALIVIILSSIITNIYILSNRGNDDDYKIEGIDTATNKDILKDKSIGKLKITNVSLLTREGMSSYKALVVNTSNEDMKIDKLYVVFYENNEENKVLVLSDTKISALGETNISITSESDLSNTEEIKYVLE